MHRRHFIQNTAFSFTALALAQKGFLSFFLQQGWKITMLTDTVGIFTERGGTIAFLLSKDGIVVVDSQFPEQSNHLIDELKKRSEKPFKLLINTHHHGDHSSGNISFKGIVEHVLAHENSKKNQEISAKRNNSEDKQLYPDQTYSNTWCQSFGKEKICVDYFGPGHTNGDSIIHFQHANVAHMGDLLFNRRHPFVDRSAGAHIKNWITVLEKAVKKFDRKTKFVFGHAAEGYEITGSLDDLNLFRDYLENVVRFVEAGIKTGKKKEEILKATEIPGSPQWKGDGIQRPLDAAFEELVG